MGLTLSGNGRQDPAAAAAEAAAERESAAPVFLGGRFVKGWKMNVQERYLVATQSRQGKRRHQIAPVGHNKQFQVRVGAAADHGAGGSPLDRDPAPECFVALFPVNVEIGNDIYLHSYVENGTAISGIMITKAYRSGKN